jgi:hypothetical protein
MLSGGLQVPEGMDDTFKESMAKMVKLVGLLYKTGIPIEAGTDSLAGFALHRELELDVQAGIPTAEVLKLATLGAPRIMKKGTELGSISAASSSTCREYSWASSTFQTQRFHRNICAAAPKYPLATLLQSVAATVLHHLFQQAPHRFYPIHQTV